jgi:hypothetical protein
MPSDCAPNVTIEPVLVAFAAAPLPAAPPMPPTATATLILGALVRSGLSGSPAGACGWPNFVYFLQLGRRRQEPSPTLPIRKMPSATFVTV